jgi:hypothetical protein
MSTHNTVAPSRVARHLEQMKAARELPDRADASAKAGLQKVKPIDFRAQIAKDIICPLLAGLTNDEVHTLIKDATGREVNPRQIAWWRTAQERPQFDMLIAVPRFRPRLLLLWAAFIAAFTAGVETETTIRVREVA